MSINALIIITIAIAGYLMVVHNRFASLRASIEAAWSDIDMQLKRRHDLIPALVDSLESHKEYEADTPESITEALQNGLNATTMNEKKEASNMLSGALAEIFALTESYPDLKANTNFLKLQGELSNIEDAIQSAIHDYNTTVEDYNFRLEAFPDMYVAKHFNYAPFDYFETTKNL